MVYRCPIILFVKHRIIVAVGILFHFVAILALIIGLPVQTTQAQAAKTLVWRRLDCDITIQPNGDLRIVETNEINFTSGSFSFGYRDIESARLTSITDVQASENGRPVRFETGRADNGDFRIKYFFATPAQNETRTLALSYTVKGATRYYAGGDQVYWACVYAARNGFAVQESRTTIRLPNTTATVAETYGAAARLSGKGETIVTATATEAIPSGKQLEVRVQFPHGIISGSPAPWQQAYDKQREFEETQKPKLDLMGLVAGALIMLFGPAGVLVMWQTRGKDPKVGLIADYITEPPSDITPGVAGTLVDEKADLQDVLATLIDLARKGVITMRESKKEKSGWSNSTDWLLSLGPNSGKALLPHEKKVFDALRLDNEERALSSLKNKFFVNLGGIKDTLYEQLVTQKFYNAKPASTRNKYIALGVFTLFLTIVSCVGSAVILDGSEYFACVPIGLGITGILTLIVAQSMPQATRAGAEAKMKMRAFKRYLENIERYTDLNTAKDQFDKFLPYAIAFGLERNWIKKFAAVDAPMPPWYVPYDPYYGSYRRGGVYGNTGGPRKSMEHGNDLPDVSDRAEQRGGIGDLDKGLTGGLNSLSAGLTSMLNTASSTFSSTPAPVASSGSSGGTGWGGGSSGGGWSGGGGGGGGSSGGGGGGFG